MYVNVVGNGDFVVVLVVFVVVLVAVVLFSACLSVSVSVYAYLFCLSIRLSSFRQSHYLTCAFLGAPTQLLMRLCPSVGWLVGWSFGHANLRRSTRQT